MQLLVRAYDSDEAMRIVNLLRDKGIATFTRSGGGWKIPDQWLIFVCLKSQFSNAARVLQNPNHEPSMRIDVEQFEAQLPSSNLGLLIKWGLATLAVVISAVAAIVMLASNGAGP